MNVVRLEKLYRLCLASFAAAMIVGVSAAAFQRDAVPEVVTTKRLAIVDEDGNVRIGLSASKEGPAIVLLNEAGQPIANWGAEKGRTSLTISDQKGVIRGGMAALPDRTMLILSNRQGAVQLQIQATDQGPSIEIISPEGERRRINP